MINKCYKDLKESYLFSDIAAKVAKYSKSNPNADIIKLGIGDVTLPLVPAVVEAMNKAAAEMGKKETFKGYGPEQGYDFLRTAVRDYYRRVNVDLNCDEVFISDGAKSDIGNILDIFSKDCEVLIPDPVYPVYVDTNVMAGRRIKYMDASEKNNFLPLPEEDLKADIIYICSPNNPTGAVYTRDMLRKWVDFANENGSVILFDSAYEAFIKDSSLPKSIYEIEGAKKCAVEFCSLSKTAGFTGTRCGYTVVPSEIVRDGAELRKLWLRRQTTKFNGVPYIIQRGAQAVFSEQGMRQIKKNIDYYLENASVIADALISKGIKFTGGVNSPYIWLKCPEGMGSWEYFDFLLSNYNIVGTPGAGFGKNGEGFFRLTAFGDRENTFKAVQRLKK